MRRQTPRVAKHPSVQGLLYAVQGLKDARGRRNTDLALSAASLAFTEARNQQQVNPRLTTMLLKEYANRGAREHAETLWRTMRRGEDPSLTPQLATALISSFGSLGAWQKAHEVLRAARSGDLANTIVYNSFLHACSRRAKAGGATGGGAGRAAATWKAQPVAAAKAARAALHRMRLDGVAADAHSTALAISVFGRAGELEAARRLLAEVAAHLDTMHSAHTTLHYTTLHYTTLHYTDTHHTTPHHTTHTRTHTHINARARARAHTHTQTHLLRVGRARSDRPRRVQFTHPCGGDQR